MLPIYLFIDLFFLHFLLQVYQHSQILVSLFVHLGLCSSGSLYIPFITMWPWLCPLFPLLWCSITLSSPGKHWCQATVMTFWLSVFMWWMRWKCTTTAKRGSWHGAKLPHHIQRGWDQGVANNKTDKHIQPMQVTSSLVYSFNKMRDV